MKKLYLIGLFILATITSQAQFTDLLNFNSTNGASPGGSLTLIGNKLFGMAYLGGAHNDGCIFSIDTTGNNYKDLLDFNGTNGASPLATLTPSLSGKVLYGITLYGGAHSDGCIFSIDTNGNAYKDLFDLDGSDGEWSYSSLILSGGLLFGTTSQGGTHSDGTIFSIDTDGTNFKSLFDFDFTNGQFPVGSMTLIGNALYGMTNYGGSSGDGNIYQIDTDGSNFQVLIDFIGTNGSHPMSSLTLSGKTFYGLTSAGGAHDSGCIFSIDTDGSRFLDRFDFTGSNGATPYSAPTFSASGKTLFGMTLSGGTHDSGCIFSVDTNGSSYKILLNGSRVFGADPLGYGSLLLTGNVLYGMTTAGGTNNDGIIFKLDTNNNVSTSTSEISSAKGAINIYPNPSNGIFTVSCRAEHVSISQTIDVYNMLGEKVYNAPLNQVQGDNIINISNQPNGIYLYRVITENGNLIREGKLIIQK